MTTRCARWSTSRSSSRFDIAGYRQSARSCVAHRRTRRVLPVARGGEPPLRPLARHRRSTMEAFATLTGRGYRPFDYFGDPEAERVIVLMGSGVETARETVDALTCAR